jgi:hypothetical protein
MLQSVCDAVHLESVKGPVLPSRVMAVGSARIEIGFASGCDERAKPRFQSCIKFAIFGKGGTKPLDPGKGSPLQSFTDLMLIERPKLARFVPLNFMSR